LDVAKIMPSHKNRGESAPREVAVGNEELSL
jgi:hypothetical protein